MATLEPSSLHVRYPVMHSTDMDGETVMLNIERGEYFGIGGVGTCAWALLEQPVSIQEITRVICSEYDEEETICLSDKLEFSGELLQNGMARTC